MPDPAGRYVDLDFLQKFWGSKQVDAWADSDGDGIRGASDDAVIQEAIDDAEDDIDAALAEAYAVPFAAPLPRMVKKLSRLRAGVYLYGRRGFREGADPAGQMRAWWDITEQLLDDLRQGKRIIPNLPRRKSVGHHLKSRNLRPDDLPF